MYAEFSYDIAAGEHSNDTVRDRLLDKFELLPDGSPRRRCDLLSDTFICEITNLNDFDTLDRKLLRLRASLGHQFSYSFSLRRPSTPFRIRSNHDVHKAQQIIGE